MIKNNSILTSICFMLFSLFAASSTAETVDEIIALVNKDPITQHEFDSKMKYVSMQYTAFQKPIPPKKQLIKEVLNKLIDTSLQMQLAEQNSITAEDSELKGAISRIAYRNKLSYNELKQNIISSGQSFGAYRDEIKTELIISKLQQQAIKPVQITEQQINDYLASTGSQDKSISYHLEDIKISLPDDSNNSDIERARAIAETLVKESKSNKDIRKIIDNINDSKYPIAIIDLGHQTKAELPHAFSPVVSTISKGGLSKPIETPNGVHVLHLIATKKVAPKSFVKQMHVFHILIRPDSMGGSSEEALKSIKKVKKEIDEGKSFTVVAKVSSHDAESAAKGGELGWSTADELPVEISRVAEKLKDNVVSDPLESPAGWHLLLVKGTKKVDMTKDLARKKAHQILFQKEMEEQLNKWLGQLRHSAYINIMKSELKDSWDN